MDQGYESSKQFVHQWLISKVSVTPMNVAMDPKSLYQHISQYTHRGTPVYKVLLAPCFQF